MEALQNRKRIALVLALVCLMLFALIHSAQGTSPLRPSLYNTYTLQAMQWRQGKAVLEEDVPHLELAIYNGQYYVSFPPVPTVPVFLLTFLFGKNVPDTLLVQAYALLSCLILYVFLSRRIPPIKAAIWAFLGCFASSLLPLLPNGAVWYQAQVLGLLLIIAALERMDAGKPTLGLLLYALAVGCRPFNALYGPVLMALYMLKKKAFLPALSDMLPGIALGLLVAAAYGWYNYIRFGNILEFGHNHLPEFSFQGGVQFSLDHVGKNASTFLWGLPFSYAETDSLTLKIFGFSLFIANPLLLCLVLWAAFSVFTGHFTLSKGLIFLFFALHTTLLLCHRTGGGFQYGARYWVDCLPWAFLWMGLPQKKPSHPRLQGIVEGLSLALLYPGLFLAFYGAKMIFLPS